MNMPPKIPSVPARTRRKGGCGRAPFVGVRLVKSSDFVQEGQQSFAKAAELQLSSREFFYYVEKI